MDFDEDLETEGFEDEEEEEEEELFEADDESNPEQATTSSIEEDEEEAPLAELLDRAEPATATLTDEYEDDDVISFEPEERTERLTSAIKPVSADEFVCQRCYLVLKRSQLADPKRKLCLDCA